uniref:Uncharacterized protein n=1 Tax=Phlebotomus papatasi TaxID=29031 RepID=A0A1B0DND0_PHLPP
MSGADNRAFEMEEARLEEIEKSEKKQDAEEVLTPSAVDPISLKKTTFLDKICIHHM